MINIYTAGLQGDEHPALPPSPDREGGADVEVDGRALRLQRRQGALPRDRLHEGRPHRLLPGRRAGAPPPPGRPPADAQALPGRRGRGVLLREAVPEPRAGVGAHGARGLRAARPRRPRDRRRSPDARLARQPRRPRAPPVALARLGPRSPDRRRLRPRPGRPGRPRRVLRGRARAARALRPARARVPRQDVGVEGPSGLRAAEPRRGDLRAHQALRPDGGGDARGPDAGPRRVAHDARRGGAAGCSWTGARTTPTRPR